MNALFLKLLNMSAAGSVLILAVALLHLLLKKAPRWILCAMWVLAAVRLVCPVSIASPVSAFRATPSIVSEQGEVEVFRPAGGSEKPMLSVETVQIERPRANVETIQKIPGTELAITQRSRDVYLPPLLQAYILGLVTMLTYAFSSTLLIKRRVAASVLLPGNIRVCDTLDSPFILGFIRPVIYLPSFLDERERAFVLAHERAHLRRRDHWWKPLGFLILSIHWFNPVCWLAYILLCRDIELACDEKVVREMGRPERVAYSQTLLNCSAHHNLAVCPVAFGETGVKTRVKAALNYKKPAFWIVLAAALACVVLAGCFATNPTARQQTEPTDAVQTEWKLRCRVQSNELVDFELPTALGKALEEKLALQIPMEGVKIERVEGWGGRYPAGADVLPVHLLAAGEDANAANCVQRNAEGRYGVRNVEAHEEICAVLDWLSEQTGWSVHADPSEFTDLNAIQLLCGERELLRIEERTRLAAFEELMQTGMYTVGDASKTPMESIELQALRADGTVLTLLLDPENPFLWLPPFGYYRYNAPESTGVRPMLDALGLDDWPEELKNPDAKVLRETYRRLQPLPDSAPSELLAASAADYTALDYTTERVVYKDRYNKYAEHTLSRNMETTTIGNRAYFFDASISEADRAERIRETEELFLRLGIDPALNICLYTTRKDTYIEDGCVYGRFGSLTGADYTAAVLLGVYGESANYGMAKGYARLLAGETPEALGELPADWAYYDLNVLCFQSKFSGEEDAALCEKLALAFAADYVEKHGDAAYLDLLRRSGQPEEAEAARAALLDFYATHGVEPVLSPILYAMGGANYDYIAKCEYASFFMEDGWLDEDPVEFGLYSKNYLHENYSEVSFCFETIRSDMRQFQEYFDMYPYRNDLPIVFLRPEAGMKYGGLYEPRDLIYLNTLESVIHEYIHAQTYHRLHDSRPTWQLEGLATYYEPLFSQHQREIFDAIYGEDWMDDPLFAELEQEIAQAPREEAFWRCYVYMCSNSVYYYDTYLIQSRNAYSSHSAYKAAASFIDYMFRQYGEREVLDYMFVNHDLTTLTDMTFAELTAAWKEENEARFAGLPKASQEG
ncbi:MAG: hypothetical protein IKI69_03465 [Oscillospiraceae bacterium]|nr:hypothetical protein [Oscillospiraceae bacterium]